MHRFIIAEFLAQEPHMVIDLDDAAIFRQVADHVVGHVARSTAQSPAGRVRSEDGSFACGENIAKSLVADV
jgi:hypothetical protein